MDPGEIWRVREGLGVSRMVPKGPGGSRRVLKYIMELHLSGMVSMGLGEIWSIQNGQEDKGGPGRVREGLGGSGRVQEDSGGCGMVGRMEEALVGLFGSGRV